MPTAFAMVLRVPVEELIALIGHDGSEIVWSGDPEPFCRRSFHIQEIIFYAWRNYSRLVTPFEARPTARSLKSKPPFEITLLPEPEWRMPELMTCAEGVLTGTTLSGSRHAVAWDGSKILDPNGTTYGVDQFLISCFWMVK